MQCIKSTIRLVHFVFQDNIFTMEIDDEQIAARSFPYALVKLCTLKDAQMVIICTMHFGLC